MANCRLDPGAADLSVGNASDHNDDAVPAQSIAANAAASTSEKQASSGAAATLTQQVAAPVGQGSADSMQIAELRRSSGSGRCGTRSALGRRRYELATAHSARAVRGGRLPWPKRSKWLEHCSRAVIRTRKPRNTQGPATTELASGLDARAHQRTDGWQSIRR